MKKKEKLAFSNEIKNTIMSIASQKVIKGGHSFIEDDCIWNPTHEFPAGEADST